MKNLMSLALFACTAFLGCGSSHLKNQFRPGNSSKNNSVELPQTPVKQQSLARCWAYAGNAFLEAEFLSKTGKEIDLSEEYVDLMRIAVTLESESRKISSLPEKEQAREWEKIRKSLSTDDENLIATGNYIMLHAFKGSPSHMKNLVRDYGIVPQSVFSSESQESDSDLVADLQKRISQYWASPKMQISAIEFAENALSGSKMFPNKFPKSFEFEGKTYNALTFANLVASPLQELDSLEARGMEDYGDIIQAVKERLAQGHTVPISVSVDWDRWGERDPYEIYEGPVWSYLSPNSGHAMLVVDFVNRGSRMGPLSPSELKYEVRRNPEDLDYLIVKNSWGTKRGGTLDGKPGYLRLTKNFLKASAKGQRFDGSLERRGFLRALVSQEIFDNLARKGSRATLGWTDDK